MDEKTLVERLRARDPEALRHFHSTYHDRILAVARRVVRDEWDAEEVAQDVYWTVYRKIDLFHGQSAFWSWVFRVTENAARMKVRTYRCRPTPMEDETIQAISSARSAAEPRGLPDSQLQARQSAEKIAEFLDTSDDLNRAIWISMDVHGMTKEEVAAELQLTIPALKARLHRIRFALREHIGADA